MNPPNEPLSPDTGARLRGDDVLQTDAGLALRATRCKSCGRATFPASTMCPFCLVPAPEAMPLGGMATLYSFTRVHVAPKAWQTPYAIGYADFPNGLRLLAKLSPADAAWSPDQKVRLRVESAGEDRFRYFFDEVPA